MDQTTVLVEGSYLDPRMPREAGRNPQKTYEFFLAQIPKISELKSLRDPGVDEADPAFIKEQVDIARAETEGLRKSLVSVCCTFAVIKKKDLIKKTDAVLKLFDKGPFGIDQVKTGLIELLQIQAELKFSLDIHGGSQWIMAGNARAAAGCFQRLLEVF